MLSEIEVVVLFTTEKQSYQLIKYKKVIMTLQEIHTHRSTHKHINNLYEHRPQTS